MEKIVVGPYNADLCQHNHSKISRTLQVYASQKKCLVFNSHWLFTFAIHSCFLYLVQKRICHFVNHFCSFCSTLHLLILILKLNAATFPVTIPSKRSICAHFFSIVINVTVDLAISFKDFQCVLDENQNLAVNHVFKFCFQM